MRFFRLATFLISGTLGFIGLYSYLMLYQTLLASYGISVMVVGYSPFLLFGIGLSLYHLIMGKRQRFVKARRTMLFSLLPICLLDSWGFITLLLWGAGWVMAMWERNHRKRAIKIVSFFSKEFSPLYDKRLSNKKNYYAYQSAYRILGLIDVSSYEELLKEEVTETDYKAGVVQKELHRTFRIKGVPFSKLTVTDKLFIAPQKMPVIGVRRY